MGVQVQGQEGALVSRTESSGGWGHASCSSEHLLPLLSEAWFRNSPGPVSANQPGLYCVGEWGPGAEVWGFIHVNL